MNPYFYLLNGEETLGPYTFGQLQGMWNAGAVTANTYFCREGDQEWSRLREFQTQLESTGKAPRDIEQKVQVIEQTSKKWKRLQLIAVIVGLLGIFSIFITANSKAYGLQLAAVISIILSGIIFLYARFSAWWHHG